VLARLQRRERLRDVRLVREVMWTTSTFGEANIAS